MATLTGFWRKLRWILMGGRPTTADANGPRWGARAEAWAELCAPFSAPAWSAGRRRDRDRRGDARPRRKRRVPSPRRRSRRDRQRHRRGRRDARCRPRCRPRGGPAARGHGEPPPGRRHVRRRHRLQRLPVRSGHDGHARRGRQGRAASGLVAVANWGRAEEQELAVVMAAARPLLPSPEAPAAPGPAVGEPGVLKGLAHSVGLTVRRVDVVDVPFVAPDEETLVRLSRPPAGASARQSSTPAWTRSATRSPRRLGPFAGQTARMGFGTGSPTSSPRQARGW